MLSLGISLDDVIRAFTHNPSKVIGCEEQFGGLREGCVADVAVFEVEEGRFEFDDWFDGKTASDKRLVPLPTILKGEILAIACGVD